MTYYELQATWTKECRSISPQTITDDMGEVEFQHAIDSALMQLLTGLSSQLRGVDPATLKFHLKEIK